MNALRYVVRLCRLTYRRMWFQLRRAVRTDKSIRTAVHAFLLLTFIVTVLWTVTALIPLLAGVDATGPYGDSFGFINALFSGLAFAGVIVAIILQTFELRYQREELNESQQTWQEQRDMMKMQAENVFLSIYLSVLTSHIPDADYEHLNEAGWLRNEKLKDYVSALEPRANAILGITPPQRTVNHWVAAGLRRQADYLKLELSRASGSQRLAELRSAMHTASSKLDSQLKGRLSQGHMTLLRNYFRSQNIAPIEDASLPAFVREAIDTLERLAATHEQRELGDAVTTLHRNDST